jgi:hypothetical protein
MRKPGIATWVGIALVLAASPAHAYSVDGSQPSSKHAANSADVVPTPPVSESAGELLRMYRILSPILGFEEDRRHAVPEVSAPPRAPSIVECSRKNAPNSSEADACRRRPAHLRFELPGSRR